MGNVIINGKTFARGPVPTGVAAGKIPVWSSAWNRFACLFTAWSIFWFTLLCLAPPVSGQYVPPRPDAGQLLRENEPPTPPPAPGTSRLRVSPEEEQPATAPDGGTILVSGFRFEGNEKVSSEALRRGVPALEQALGTDIGLGALNALANRVTQYYRNQGFLIATAYLPPQEVEGGIVTIAVFEGKIDSAGIVESGGYAVDRIKRLPFVFSMASRGALPFNRIFL